MARDWVLLRSTYGLEADAAAAGRMLIEGKWACCVHLEDVRSIYAWKGKVQDEREWLLEVRLRAEDVDVVWDQLLSNHPYDTPLVEVLGAVQVPAPYSRWATTATRR